MKWLIAPFTLIGLAAVAGVFFRRKKSTSSYWGQAKDKATSAVSGAADQVKSAVSS
jgi:cell shape-determining protein MreC